MMRVLSVLMLAAVLCGAVGCASGPHAKPGFVTAEEDGRLLVRKPDQELTDKCVTLLGVGPDGMTVKAPDRQTALEYLGARPGFTVKATDEKTLWVLAEGQEESEKQITLLGRGPLNSNLKAVDRETIEAYLSEG